MFFYALKGIIVIALLTFEPPIQLLYISLVPRPFPPPVCDYLKYAITEEEGLGDFIMCSYVR